MNGRFETYVRPNSVSRRRPLMRADLILGWPYAEFEANKRESRANFIRKGIGPRRHRRHACVPRNAKRRLRGFRPEIFREAIGPGWALVGDAGYNKDPITAQASPTPSATPSGGRGDRRNLSGGRPWDEAMGDYQRARDEHVLPMYEFTCQLATLHAPAPDAAALRGHRGNQSAMDGSYR